MEVLAVIGGLLLVYLVAKAGASAGNAGRQRALPQGQQSVAPSPAKPKRNYVEGVCEGCKFRGRVYAITVMPGVLLCSNCGALAFRNRGRSEEYAHLPPGAVDGICRTCNQGKVVALDPQGSWTCAECAGKAAALAQVTTFVAACPGCAYQGRLYVEPGSNVARCFNCAKLNVRDTGDAPEWNELPPGHIVGDCYVCKAEKSVVSRSKARIWTCLTCAASTVMAETDALLRKIAGDDES